MTKQQENSALLTPELNQEVQRIIGSAIAVYHGNYKSQDANFATRLSKQASDQLIPLIREATLKEVLELNEAINPDKVIIISASKFATLTGKEEK